jgi:hypothetical protein
VSLFSRPLMGLLLRFLFRHSRIRITMVHISAAFVEWNSKACRGRYDLEKRAEDANA